MLLKLRFFGVLLLFSLLTGSRLIGAEVPDALRLLLKEVSYIGTDYPAAVEGGVIVSEEEYREMIEFSASAKTQFEQIRDQIGADDAALIDRQLAELESVILEKGSQESLLGITQTLVKKITLVYKVPVSPEHPPLLELGHHVYTHRCAVCHGVEGRGDGPGGVGREPAPRDFFDSDVMNVSSPFKFYNILLTGIEGTDMASFRDQLSEEELWSVSFYLSSLRFHNASEGVQPEIFHQMWDQVPGVSLNKLLGMGLNKGMLAGSGDQEVLSWFNNQWQGETMPDSDKILALLRLSAPFHPDVPLKEEDGGKSVNKDEKIKQALKYTLLKIDDAKSKGDEGSFFEAEQLLLDAYLNGYEQTETRLSLIDRGFVTDAERLFMDSRGYARSQDGIAFQSSLKDLRNKIVESLKAFERQLEGGKTGWGDFFASFTIIVREGLEAFLVVAALLALLTGMGAHEARRWVHAGWLTALIAGGLTFVLFEQVLDLSGAAKESVEAICTGIAVVLLFYTGFWLLSQAEHQKWHRFVKEKTQTALSSGRLWGLFSISFIAVYREAAETVLFYSALYSGSENPVIISAGFFVGCALLLSVCWSVIRFNLKLPLKQFFKVTSVLMVAISIVLTGKTVHELIEAGYLHPTPVAWLPSIDILGIYPSVETLAAQITLLMAGGVIAYVISRKPKNSAV